MRGVEADDCLYWLTLPSQKQESWLLPTERASAVKTRMNGLSCGEKNMTFSRFDTIPACDRQTDGRADRIWIAKTCFELLRG